MLNPHFHLVVRDGVFSHASDSGARFHEAAHLEPDHWIELQGSGGFSIDASVRIQGDDRAGIERLLR